VDQIVPVITPFSLSTWYGPTEHVPSVNGNLELVTIGSQYMSFNGTGLAGGGGSIAWGPIVCTYDVGQSSATEWVCAVGAVDLSSPPSLLAVYQPILSISMEDSYNIEITLDTTITYPPISITPSTLVINNNVTLTDFNEVTVEFSAAEWSLADVEITVGIASDDSLINATYSVPCVIDGLNSDPFTVVCKIAAITDCDIISAFYDQPLYFLIRSNGDSSNVNYNRTTRSVDSFKYPAVYCPKAPQNLAVGAAIQGEATVTWSHGSGSDVTTLLPYSVSITSTTFATPLHFDVVASSTLSATIVSAPAILEGESFTITITANNAAGTKETQLVWSILDAVSTLDSTSTFTCDVGSDIMVSSVFNCTATARAGGVAVYVPIGDFGFTASQGSITPYMAYYHYAKVFPLSVATSSQSSLTVLASTATGTNYTVRVYAAPLSSTISCTSNTVVAGGTLQCMLEGETAGGSDYTLASAYVVSLTQTGTSSITTLSPAIISSTSFSFVFTAGTIADSVTIQDATTSSSFAVTVTVPVSSSSSSSTSEASSSSSTGVDSSSVVSSSAVESSSSSTGAVVSSSSSTSTDVSSSSSSSTGEVASPSSTVSSSSTGNDASSSVSSTRSDASSSSSSSSSSTGGSLPDVTISGAGTVTFVLTVSVADADRSGSVFIAIRAAIASLGVDIDRIIDSFVSLVRSGTSTTVTIGILPATSTSVTAASTYVAVVVNAIEEWKVNSTANVLGNAAIFASSVSTTGSVSNSQTTNLYRCNGVYQTQSCTSTDDSDDWWTSSDPIGIGLSFVVCVVILAIILVAIVIGNFYVFAYPSLLLLFSY
jgi:hypothetical protein